MTKNILKFALAGTLAFGVSMPLASLARADHDWNHDCHDRLQADKVRIDREAARHGNDSPEVRHAVDKMEKDRQWCRDHHADWDHNVFDVGIYLGHH
jgi:hypothetical protein